MTHNQPKPLAIVDLRRHPPNLHASLMEFTLRGVHESARVRFVPNSDSTRQTWVGEIGTHNRPVQSFGSAGSGLVGFRCISGNFGFATGGLNLARFWSKSGRISKNLANIPPCPSSLCPNLAIFVEIQPKSHYIGGVLSLDLSDFHWNTRLELRSHYICR